MNWIMWGIGMYLVASVLSAGLLWAICVVSSRSNRP